MDNSMSSSGEINISAATDNSLYNQLLLCLFALSPNQLTVLSSLIAIALINNLDLEKQNVLGAFIANIGQAISTAAAQGQLLQTETAPNMNGKD